MINEALSYIRRKVRDGLDPNVSDGEVILGNIHALKENTNQRGVYISLVNLEEEATLKNTNHYRRNDDAWYPQQTLYLNLYLLFAFNFQDYSASLIRLSKTVEFFLKNPVFPTSDESAANSFPTELEKLIFDIYNLNFEQLNHLWSILGGAYFPSVLYKVRLIKVHHIETDKVKEVETIVVETNPL
ncbi:MAG TPA: DUF4255 domain-containing protein [Candidatus Deferrimicrobium sp.]|nr:DUF4255 domain-containing protein [Candidatus Deferrimicrobium sp.]